MVQKHSISQETFTIEHPGIFLAWRILSVPSRAAITKAVSDSTPGHSYNDDATGSVAEESVKRNYSSSENRK